MSKRKALGKGLSALIPEAQALIEETEGYFSCPVELIDPNPFQPRKDFSPSELREMADSVKEKGILTPLLVSKNGDRYQLIAGERRLRAAKMAGVERVPVVVREVSPAESLELAIIENVHRKDLNPIEEAAGGPCKKSGEGEGHNSQFASVATPSFSHTEGPNRRADEYGACQGPRGS